MQVADILNKKVAVLTDNDKDYKTHITNKYSEYESKENIEIYSEKDSNNYTFEVCLYNNNVTIYEENIKTTHMTNGVLDYMLNNKAEVAFRLLEFMRTPDYKNDFVIPEYIKGAIEWINRSK